MAQYRKRPVVIEAEQWWPESHVDGVCTENDDAVQGRDHIHTGTPHIHTLEGDHLVSPGDFVITGVKGEKYACKPDIFEMTYEAVDS